MTQRGPRAELVEIPALDTHRCFSTKRRSQSCGASCWPEQDPQPEHRDIHDPLRLRRAGHTLQPRHVTLISLGGIIGAGLFVGSSAAINMAGPSVLISYALSAFWCS